MAVFSYTPPAGTPPSGTNCQSTDGKIDGRGATYQEEPQQTLLTKSFTLHDCSKEVPLQFAGDPAGGAMVTYNYPSAKEHSVTGSGAGIKAMECRTDDFAGSDVPYEQSQLHTLNGPPLAAGECTIAAGFATPFAPLSPWPSAEDHETKMMSFPIGGSSDGILVHLTSASCGGSAPPETFSFTPTELSRIFGGDAKTWNDEELVKNNAGLSVCTAAIQRVVRQDNSGTTNILKNMLVNEEERLEGAAEPKEKGVILNNRENSAEPSEAGKHTFTCAPAHKWTAYYAAPNTNWPHEAEGGTCSPEAVHGPASGNAEEIKKISEQPNGIGYADLPQAEAIGVEEDGEKLATVRNAKGTGYKAPNNGKAANCNFAASGSLPGINAEESVGLNTLDDWANNNKAENGKPNHANTTLKGELYPICGLTFDLVYTHNASSTDAKVGVKRMSADQRMTEFAYFSWMLNEGAQKELGKLFYAPLPASWLELLRPGFENCYAGKVTGPPEVCPQGE
jgi:ABC-type phosphate transport system substrate-binding protein